MTNAQLVPVILAPFVAWRFYHRFRRNIGRQKLRATRMKVALIIMMIALGLIAGSVIYLRAPLWPLLGGLAAGIMVGLIGHKLTRFETGTSEKFYTPNAYLSITISTLLVARLAYRFFLLYTTPLAAHATAPALGQSLLTMFIFGLTLGYYITYNAGILRSLRQAPQTQPV